MLNTPARIDIIEAMGHLERADAEFLRDAATFYRAMDHGLRVWSGHAEGSLPNSESQLALLTAAGAALDPGAPHAAAAQSPALHHPESKSRAVRPSVFKLNRNALFFEQCHDAPARFFGELHAVAFGGLAGGYRIADPHAHRSFADVPGPEWKHLARAFQPDWNQRHSGANRDQSRAFLERAQSPFRDRPPSGKMSSDMP